MSRWIWLISHVRHKPAIASRNVVSASASIPRKSDALVVHIGDEPTFLNGDVVASSLHPTGHGSVVPPNRVANAVAALDGLSKHRHVVEVGLVAVVA